MDSIEPIFKNPSVHEKGWGREIWIDNNDEYCGKILEFAKGSCFSSHFHINKRETFYVLKGSLILSYKDLSTGHDKSEQLKKFDVVEIPRFCPHRITAIEDSVIIEISTHHEDSDSYRISPGDSQKNK